MVWVDCHAFRKRDSKHEECLVNGHTKFSIRASINGTRHLFTFHLALSEGEHSKMVSFEL